MMQKTSKTGKCQSHQRVFFGPAHLVCKMTTSMCAMYRVRTVTGFLMDKVRVPEASLSCYVAITAKIDGSTVNFPRYVSNYMTLVMKF